MNRPTPQPVVHRQGPQIFNIPKAQMASSMQPVGRFLSVYQLEEETRLAVLRSYAKYNKQPLHHRTHRHRIYGLLPVFLKPLVKPKLN